MNVEVLSYSVANSKINIHPCNPEQKIVTDYDPENFNVLTGECELHMHEECEMALCFDGRFCFYVNDVEYALLPGDIIFINSSVPHATRSYYADNFLIQAEIAFSTGDTGKIPRQILTSMEKDVAVFRAGTPAAQAITESFMNIKRENIEKNKSYEMFIRAEMFKVFAVLYREGILKSAAEVFSEKGVERLLPVLDYVDTHFKDDIKLEDACRILNVNKAHFCRLFKKTVGMSFVTYLNFVKVTKAEKMLMTTDKSISEIAEETGFSSAAYFAEIFKIHMHRSPGKYKKIKTEEEIQKQVNP